MKSINRDLAIGMGLSALAFVCALAWGNPFVGANGVSATQTQAQPQTPPPQRSPSQPSPGQTQPPPDQTQTQSQTFTGTIIKKGSHYCLQDQSGQVYRLDDSDSAKAYMGKSVKVTGQLDQQAMLIHVQNIQSAQT